MEGPGKLSTTNAVGAAWGKSRSLLRQFGVMVACLYAFNWLARRLSRGRARLVPYALYAQPVGAGRFASVRDDAHTVIDLVTPSDPISAAFPRPAAVIRGRFENGAACYAASVKQDFGGFIWISRERYVEDEVRCQYILSAPGISAWDFDVYVEPRFRLGRTMARLWKHVDAALARDGVRWSFSRISRFNATSLGAHQRLGAIQVGSAVFVVLGSLQLALLSFRPFLHVSFGAADGPNIRLSPPRALGQEPVP